MLNPAGGINFTNIRPMGVSQQPSGANTTAGQQTSGLQSNNQTVSFGNMSRTSIPGQSGNITMQSVTSDNAN